MSSAGSVGGSGSLRLFLGLRLPDDVLDVLDAWSAASLSGCRRVRRDDLHVTLAFIGRRPASDLPAIVSVLREEAGEVEPFALDVGDWRETRSVGMITLRDTTGRATRLARCLHARLDALGLYRPERRPWLPHVTVARFRVRPRLDPSPPALRTLVPSDAAAFLSSLHPSGARYAVLESTPLGPRHTTIDDTAPRGGSEG